MIQKIRKFSAISLMSLVIILFSSCDDTSEQFTISGSPTAPVLADLGITKIELDAVNTNNPAITLNWNDADYGHQAAINYQIQFSKDETFAEPALATSVTGQTSVTLSVAEVNTAAGNAGLNPFEWKPVYIRVMASLGTLNDAKVASNTITLEVYPYFNYTFNDYYLVGDATAPGWNNNMNNPPLFRDANDSNIFYYTGKFADNGHFKVLTTKGLWQPQYGTNDGSTVEANLGSGSDPERFPYGGGNGIPEGFYTFRMDFSTNTFTFDAYDASGATSPASLTLKGTSTADVAMTALSFDGHIWYANSVKLTPGEVNFVTDAGAAWGNTTSFSGVATSGGGSIPIVVEDDYDVWFNDLTGQYILIPLNL